MGCARRWCGAPPCLVGPTLTDEGLQ
ncbi:hypothetical protein A2U01_0036162, partial [Trifolium medium]|nr:hypothetical protein [Trifolium medium]